MTVAYATYDDFKEYRGIESDSDQQRIEALLVRASAIVETYTGRCFKAEAASVRYFSDAALFEGALILDGDLAELVSVTNGDGAVIPIDKVRGTPRNKPPWWKLQILGSAELSWSADALHGEIGITGYWCYSKEPPADVVQAVLRLTAFLYAQKDGNSYDTISGPTGAPIIIPQGLPRDLLALLAGYQRVV